MVSDDADGFKTAAEANRLDHQVCTTHGQRNTYAWVEGITPLLATDEDRSLITIGPVTAHQVSIARRAHQRFGKGTGHPARLNFGDCFAYALAIHYDEPLLFIGQDFTHTDVRRVLN